MMQMQLVAAIDRVAATLHLRQVCDAGEVSGGGYILIWPAFRIFG